MLSFQSPQQFVIILIAICLTHFTFTQADTVQCQTKFSSRASPAMCVDKEQKTWSCPAKGCTRDGKPFSTMRGCVHASFPGQSEQQCVSYSFVSSNGQFDCWNSGNQQYSCAYKPSDVPFITCSSCTQSNTGKRM